MMHFLDKTLAQQVAITEDDLAERKILLGLEADEERLIGSYHDIAEMIVDDVVADFYAEQVAIAAFRRVYSDRDTLRRLHGHLTRYVLRLFSGSYGMDHVNARLKIGLTHARIGIPPKHYCASHYRLQQMLFQHLRQTVDDDGLYTALSKLLMLDLQLVLDSYIQNVMREVEHVQTAQSTPTLARQAPQKPLAATPQSEDDTARIISRTLQNLNGSAASPGIG